VNAAQIRKVVGDFREHRATPAMRGAARTVRKTTQDRAFSAHRWSFAGGNGNCLISNSQIQPRSRQARPLMLDVLIERVSYEPMAIFIIVAVVLLIMLARTVS
jgi:hypothetical protein